MRERLPRLHVTLVEADLRKSAFLREAVRVLGLSAKIQSTRAESLEPLDADVVSARALAPLGQLLSLAKRHLNPCGVAVLLKGERHADEIESARSSWTFDLQCRQSQSHPDAAILVIGKIERAKTS